MAHSEKLEPLCCCNEGAAQKLDLGLKWIYVNARSIVNKMDYLKDEVKVFDPDIIGITESWTDDK